MQEDDQEESSSGWVMQPTSSSNSSKGKDKSDKSDKSTKAKKRKNATLPEFCFWDGRALRLHFEKLYKWTPSEWIDFCLLLGHDDTPRISGIGPVAIVALIAFIVWRLR